MVINFLKDKRCRLRHLFGVGNDPTTAIGFGIHFLPHVREARQEFYKTSHGDLNLAPVLITRYPTVVMKFGTKVVMRFALKWYVQVIRRIESTLVSHLDNPLHAVFAEIPKLWFQTEFREKNRFILYHEFTLKFSSIAYYTRSTLSTYSI